jgi:hypothetical protein
MSSHIVGFKILSVYQVFNSVSVYRISVYRMSRCIQPISLNIFLSSFLSLKYILSLTALTAFTETQ